jgi:2-desacetyl-2-hydroxyethyl bacteriochlorophyllide A dehydrogenase
MEIRTVSLDQPGNFRFTTTEAPAAPGPGEALVRVHNVGICGTDIHAFHGRQPFFSYPRILGHELGVEVMSLGPNVEGLRVGDRCSVEPYLHCGHCVACRQGRINCCVNLQVLGVNIDGGMRERIVVPAAKLHPSNTLSYEQLALVETLAIGAHAVQRAQLQPDEWALVIGAGPIGLSVMQFAHLDSARVIALDVSEERLAFCRTQGTADHTILGRADPLSALQDLTNGELPTVVFDATGNAQSMIKAFEYTAHTARLIFVGLMQGDITFNDPMFHRRELTLLASRNSLPENFTRIIAHIEAGEIDTRPWITHRVGCEVLPETFPGWLQPGSSLIKGMVSFEE